MSSNFGPHQNRKQSTMFDSAVKNAGALEALCDLLNPEAEGEDKGVDKTAAPKPPGIATPADIGPAPAKKPAKKDAKSIWDEEEVDEGDADIDDGRTQPEFDVLFSQDVSSEDMYLGIGGKDNSTMCCENIIVKVKLPGQQLKDVNLDVTERRLVVTSPKYRLTLPLERPVDDKKGSAKFDSDKEVLTVKLPSKIYGSDDGFIDKYLE